MRASSWNVFKIHGHLRTFQSGNLDYQNKVDRKQDDQLQKRSGGREESSMQVKDGRVVELGRIRERKREWFNW